MGNSEDSTYKTLLVRVLKDFSEFIKKIGYDIYSETNNQEILKNSDLSLLIKQDEVNVNNKTKKTRKSWLCPHFCRPHYARGKCQNCYLKTYHKVNADKKKK